jgi:hypothetical protein
MSLFSVDEGLLARLIWQRSALMKVPFDKGPLRQRSALTKVRFDKGPLWQRSALTKVRFDKGPIQQRSASTKVRFNKGPLQQRSASTKVRFDEGPPHCCKWPVHLVNNSASDWAYLNFFEATKYNWQNWTSAKTEKVLTGYLALTITWPQSRSLLFWNGK